MCCKDLNGSSKPFWKDLRKSMFSGKTPENSYIQVTKLCQVIFLHDRTTFLSKHKFQTWLAKWVNLVNTQYDLWLQNNFTTSKYIKTDPSKYFSFKVVTLEDTVIAKLLPYLKHFQNSSFGVVLAIVGTFFKTSLSWQIFIVPGKIWFLKRAARYSEPSLVNMVDD